MTLELPISVWPTAQRTTRAQRTGRYLPVSIAHPAKMLPAIAQTAIADYSAPGDYVLDPMCGIGTTLVEPVHLGREAIGIEYEATWADLARANLEHARTNGATASGEVVCGDARNLASLIDPALRGLIALVLTSPPYGSSAHGQVRTTSSGVFKEHYRYSRDPANLAHVGLERLLGAMRTVFVGCRQVLRPGGVVATTLQPGGRGELVDLPGALPGSGRRPGSCSSSATSPCSPGCGTTISSLGHRSSPSTRCAGRGPRGSPAASSPMRISWSLGPLR